MATRKIYKIIVISTIVFAVFFTLRTDFKNGDSTPEVYTETIGVSVRAGSQKIHLLPVSGSSLYEVLLAAQKSGLIEFSGENYLGLGFFVTKIGSLQSGGGKYLFYYINGKEASVGVSSYILRDGDFVEWKLK